MSRETGTVKKWFSDRNFGFIEPDKGGDDLYFNSKNTNLPISELRRGTKVEFEEGRGDRGTFAKNVALPGTTKEIPPRGYRFLNPYNFIRVLPRRQPSETDSDAVKLLGFAPPPTHDRYLGLSGKISCELRTITPLFISASEGVTQVQGDNGKPHNRYRFFQLNGKKAIPASSLRGMLRSAYEAVTNSPFSNLGGGQLSFRLESDEVRKLVPGRVEKDEQGNLVLRLLLGSATLRPNETQKKLHAAPARFYKALKPPREHRNKVPQPLEESAELQHGEMYWAVLQDTKLWQRAIAIYPDAQSAHQKKNELAHRSDKPLSVERGWMCITNQNADNKSNERFLFRTQSENRNVPEFVNISAQNRKDYEALIADYQARHADDVSRTKNPGKANHKTEEIAFSRHVLNRPERKLSGGELVFVRLRGSVSNLSIDYMAPVSWPRVSYKNSIADLLAAWSPHLMPQREQIDALSPAARLFGWVDGEEQGAYAGRVRLSNGKLEKNGRQLDAQTLSILGSPKPTTTRFYLLPPDGKPKSGRSDVDVGYDGKDNRDRPNRLRGRKAYRHFTERKHSTTPLKSDQNRTVIDPEGEGATFTFDLTFESLAPVELGALLWTLSLGGKGYHRLGYAKPLGYGSVEITPTSVELMDTITRYQGLDDGGMRGVSTEDQTSLIRNFQRAFLNLYVRSHFDSLQDYADKNGEDIWRHAFEDLPNIADMLTLWSKTAPELPVHYPFSSDPSTKGHFEWFMGNKRTGGLRLELSLPSRDKGLPLIDKRGKPFD